MSEEAMRDALAAKSDAALRNNYIYEHCFLKSYTEETESNRLFDPDTGGGACLDVGVYPYEYATGIMDAPPDDCKIMKVMGPTGVDLSVGMLLRYKI